MQKIAFIISCGMILILLGCRSTAEVDEDSSFLRYESLQLDFSLEYPRDWKLFEGSESIFISDSQNVLISPGNEQLVDIYDLIITVSVADNDILVNFIEYLLEVADNTAMNDIPFSRSLLRPLESLVSEEEIEIIYNYYELIFDADAEPMYYYEKDASVILETSTSYNNDLHTIYMLRTLSQSVVVSMEIEYVEEVLDKDYFSDMHAILQSVEIMEPIE